MENFAPGLRTAIIGLTNDLRVIVFFICVAGFMVHVQRARADLESLIGPVVRVSVIVGLIATLPYWFGLTDRMFLSLADTLNAGYTEHPMQTAASVRATVTDTGDAWSFRKIGESFYKAFLYAAVKLVVLIGSLLQLPFLVLQFILKLLCYLFLPIALALFMVPSLASLGVRYIQQTLAVLAWPVGFAVTELVAYYLLTAYTNNMAVAYGLQPGEINAASFGSLIGGLLAALWLIIGTLGTPFLMQMLFCSGSPLSGGGQSALQQFYTMQQLAWLVKSVKTGGVAAVGAAVARAGQAGGNSGGSMPPPPPVMPGPPAPVAPAPADPSGDARTSSLLSRSQLPAPQTTI